MPPVNVSPFMEWDRTSPVTEKTVYTDAEIFTAPPGAIAWLIEPIHGRQDAYDFLIERSKTLKEIWTCDRALLQMISNGVFVPFGGCWIHPDHRTIWNKTKSISTITSRHRGNVGYDLRHETVARFRDRIDCFGIEYTPLELKIDALRDYRFHVVIENVQCDYWFTEKLIDCFATGTIPIYRGCPSIGDFFDLDGMIIVQTIDDIGAAFEKCTPEYYSRHEAAILNNFVRAKQFYLSEDWLCLNHREKMEQLTI